MFTGCREFTHFDWVAMAALCFLAVVFPARSSRAADLGQAFEARKVTVAIYADGFSDQAAVLKVDRIFTDRRRLGFFRVKLLPVLVAQGVHVELSQSTPNTNWLTSFRVKLTPLTRNRVLEWRDVTVRLPQDTQPRLRAGRLFLPENESEEFCRLEGVTFQTETGEVKVPRARLLLTAPSGRLIWEADGSTVEWNLFTGSLFSEKTKINPQEKL